MSGKPSPEEPNTIPPTATDDSATETGADGGTGPQSAEEVKQAGDEGTAADSRVVELDAQIADLTDRLLRAHAEMDNIRKRAERDKAETAKYAISKFAADIAVLSDNFQRAIEAVPAGAADINQSIAANSSFRRVIVSINSSITASVTDWGGIRLRQWPCSCGQMLL